jgi:hypothetical protein
VTGPDRALARGHSGRRGAAATSLLAQLGPDDLPGYGADPVICRQCGSKLRVIAFITDSLSIDGRVAGNAVVVVENENKGLAALEEVVRERPGAWLTTYPGMHRTLMYGAYSNATRGKRKKTAASAKPPSAAEVPEDAAIPDGTSRAAPPAPLS